MNITRIDELYLKLKQQYPRYYHEHDLYIDKIYKLAKNYSQYINYEQTMNISREEAKHRLNAIIKNNFYLVIENS